MIEAALWSNACLSIVLLSIAVLVSVPFDNISAAMTPLQEVRNITQASSWSSFDIAGYRILTASRLFRTVSIVHQRHDMKRDGLLTKEKPFLLMIEAWVRTRDCLALVAATYIFFHSLLKNSCCSSSVLSLQK